MKKCSFCGEINPDSTDICPWCGRTDPNLLPEAFKNQNSDPRTPKKTSSKNNFNGVTIPSLWGRLNKWHKFSIIFALSLISIILLFLVINNSLSKNGAEGLIVSSNEETKESIILPKSTPMQVIIEEMPSIITPDVTKSIYFEKALMDILKNKDEEIGTTLDSNDKLQENSNTYNENQITLKEISFHLPPDMIEIDEGYYYSTDLPLLLSVIIYDSKNYTILTVLEEWIDKVISVQTNIEESKFIFLGKNLEGEGVTIFALRGRGKSEAKVEWEGALASIEHNGLIYLFAWDAFGADSIIRLPEDYHALMKTLVLN